MYIWWPYAAHLVGNCSTPDDLLNTSWPMAGYLVANYCTPGSTLLYTWWLTALQLMTRWFTLVANYRTSCGHWLFSLYPTPAYLMANCFSPDHSPLATRCVLDVQPLYTRWPAGLHLEAICCMSRGRQLHMWWPPAANPLFSFSIGDGFLPADWNGSFFHTAVPWTGNLHERG